MMMAMLKVVFQNTAPACSRPSRLLAEINRQFYTVLKSRASFTAYYAILKPEPWRMVSASAGHPNPLLFRPGAADLRPVQTSGMAIGFFPDCEYEDVEIPLEHGDRVLFYTDGLSDLAIEEGFFKEFETLFQKKSSQSTSNLLECLLYEIYKFRSKQEDDITLLLLRH